MNAYQECLRDQTGLDEARRYEAVVLAVNVISIQVPVDTTFFEMVERIEKYLKGDGGSET